MELSERYHRLSGVHIQIDLFRFSSLESSLIEDFRMSWLIDELSYRKLLREDSLQGKEEKKEKDKMENL